MVGSVEGQSRSETILHKMTATFSNPRINPQYSDALLVLRDGTEFPIAEVFTRNPSTFDIRGIRCAQHPHIVSFAKGWSVWDGTQHVLTRMSLGASDTFLCCQDYSGA